MEGCRFCQIIDSKGKDEEIIYENEQFIILIDKYRTTSVGPICLVIPKEHKANILDLEESIGADLIKILKLVGGSMQEVFNSKGIRIWTAVNKEAGQSIFHCHIHVLACNSISDRFIASFPGIYDLASQITRFGRRNRLRQEQNLNLVRVLKNEISQQHNKANAHSFKPSL